MVHVIVVECKVLGRSGGYYSSRRISASGHDVEIAEREHIETCGDANARQAALEQIQIERFHASK